MIDSIDVNDVLLLSSAPTEIRIEIFKRCDAMSLFLNWDEAALLLPASTLPPTPSQIWVAALQLDQLPRDISTLPLIDRGQKYRQEHRFCLPDASVLCRFIKSKSALQKICNSGLPVPCDVFETTSEAPYEPCVKYAAHAAMRHCWHDMIDIFNLSIYDKEEFPVYGSHWEYFLYLWSDNRRIRRRYDKDEFFDYAAQNGELALLMKLPSSIHGSAEAMDWAASKGHLDVVQWLHHNRTEGCTKYAMNCAAMNGHLDVVKWLHSNRTEGNVEEALAHARRGRHKEIFQYLQSQPL